MSGAEPRPTVLHVITGLGHGGAENVLDRLVRADGRNRHIVVSLHTEGALGPGLRAAGCEVHALGFELGSLRAGGLVRLWRIIRAARPEVVQTWMYHPNVVGGVFARLAGVPAICWNLRRTTLEQTSVKTRAIGKLGAWLSRAVPDRIICCATSVADAHVRHGYDAARMVVIPNGIDTQMFAPDAAARDAGRAALGVAAGATLIGCVGRVHADKDHRSLFAAFGRIGERRPDVRCVLAGTETDSAALRALAAEMGVADRLICLGERSDLPAVMNLLDVHVSASVTEGFPNVIAEAMACGVPCVATDAGDSAAIIGDHGWVVPVSAEEQLAEALGAALGEIGTPRWAALKQAVRARIERDFALATMVAAYRAVWAAAAQPAEAGGIPATTG